MSAGSVGGRQAVLLAAIVCYAGVSLAFVFLESPGLGIGHLFVVPICLVALVTNELVGALAGVFATGLYVLSVVESPEISSSRALTGASLIRLVAYVAVGTLIGFFASRNRQLVDRLRDLAERDFVTGLGNARRFDDELARRCASGKPFSLVLADVDDLAELNNRHGHAAGNGALKRVGEVLQQHAEIGRASCRERV